MKVVGIGGAGGNAVLRMQKAGVKAVEYLAINTDVQALGRIQGLPTFAIGPGTTCGMGSGGNADVGKKAMRESQEQVAQLLEGSDMVFLTAGMGGGTGTGAAPVVADLARKQGALTVAFVTRPFSFEGPRRRELADHGLDQLRQKVDTLIAVDNNRLLPSLGDRVSLESAFRLADDVLRQGVQGISEIVAAPGLVNVDFADVRAVVRNGGPAFLAMGEGKGKRAAIEAAKAALANPLFDVPLKGAGAILFNVRGGHDLALGQVHEVAEIIKGAAGPGADVFFGVVQDRRWRKRVRITVVATGLAPAHGRSSDRENEEGSTALLQGERKPVQGKAGANGRRPSAAPAVQRIF